MSAAYDDTGIIDLSGADEANIPVNSFLTEPKDNEDGRWHWIADNFMPRRAHCSQDQYHLVSDAKEPLLEAVKKYVVPIYKAALENLKTMGENYYWEQKPHTPSGGR